MNFPKLCNDHSISLVVHLQKEEYQHHQGMQLCEEHNSLSGIEQNMKLRKDVPRRDLPSVSPKDRK